VRYSGVEMAAVFAAECCFTKPLSTASTPSQSDVSCLSDKRMASWRWGGCPEGHRHYQAE